MKTNYRKQLFAVRFGSACRHHSAAALTMPPLTSFLTRKARQRRVTACTATAPVGVKLGPTVADVLAHHAKQRQNAPKG